MRLLDLDLPTPAGNLAADEALLDHCEAGAGDETLRFWEPRETFVVVGYANRVAAEVNVAVCQQRNIPVYRRCSGGGTVVQLPGGLNYSLILRITDHGPTRNISTANQYIMDRNRAAIQAALGTASPVVSVCGHTDLALAGNGGSGGSVRKVSGNSQRRRKHFLLFHGTLLLNCDLAMIGELLRMPSLQPDYRAHRPHTDFLANLHLPAATVKAALAEAWGAKNSEHGADDALRSTHYGAVLGRYLTREWNDKF